MNLTRSDMMAMATRSQNLNDLKNGPSCALKNEYISLTSYPRQRLEITKFKVFRKAWQYAAEVFFLCSGRERRCY